MTTMHKLATQRMGELLMALTEAEALVSQKDARIRELEQQLAAQAPQDAVAELMKSR